MGLVLAHTARLFQVVWIWLVGFSSFQSNLPARLHLGYAQPLIWVDCARAAAAIACHLPGPPASKGARRLAPPRAYICGRCGLVCWHSDSRLCNRTPLARELPMSHACAGPMCGRDRERGTRLVGGCATRIAAMQVRPLEVALACAGIASVVMACVVTGSLLASFA